MILANNHDKYKDAIISLKQLYSSVISKLYQYKKVSEITKDYNALKNEKNKFLKFKKRYW